MQLADLGQFGLSDAGRNGRGRQRGMRGGAAPRRAALIEALEPRVMMAGDAASPITPVLTVTDTGFTIAAGSVRTQGDLWVAGEPPRSVVRVGGTLTYAYTRWTVAVTPTVVDSGVRIEMVFTNTGAAASVIPGFSLFRVEAEGGIASQWKSNVTEPVILNQALADGTHMAFTIDDATFPIVAEFVNATNPANGTVTVTLLPDGGQYKRYNIGLTPLVVEPGASATIPGSLRFGPDYESVSRATNAGWAEAYPYSLQWSDRRMMLRGDLFQYNPTRSNPQGFQGRFNINLKRNFKRFETFVLSYAANAVESCRLLNAGTWLEWDLEGKQLGHDYKGNPHLIEGLNAAWRQTDANGVALTDRFFKVFHDAGIHVGVTIRPWTLKLSNGRLVYDASVGSTESIVNHIDYARERWGIDAFYNDSPEYLKTSVYRDILAARPEVLLVPEYAPESWMQFCVPMVWNSENLINWVTLPRSIYGDTGWGVYFHQDLTNPVFAANFAADAARGCVAMPDGWMGMGDRITRAAYEITTRVARERANGGVNGAATVAAVLPTVSGAALPGSGGGGLSTGASRHGHGAGGLALVSTAV